MSFIPAPGVAQFTFVGSWNNLIPLRSIFHVQRKNDGLFEPWSAADLHNGVTRILSLYTKFLPEMVNDASFTSVVARSLDVEAGVVIEEAIVMTGGSAASPMGAFAGPVVNWKTGLAGRTNGRTFLPGVAEGNVDDNGQLASTYVAALQLDANNGLTSIGAATDATHPGPPMNLVILATAGSGDPVGRAARPVVSAAIRAEVGIQRRRRLS